MQQRKPIIGVSSSFSGKPDAEQVTINQNYLEAVRHAGGIPLILPVDASEEELSLLISRCDGMVLTGGADIDPRLYGEEILNDSVSLAPVRDRGEKRLCALAEARGIPLLGICRGVQYLNVYYGGDLYQDIPSQLQTDISHRQTEPRFSFSHDVKVLPGTPLHNLVGKDRMRANSFHHQSVKDLGQGLSVMALSDDGIIEALFLEGSQYLRAYQWHPERLFDISEDNRAILEEFIRAC